MRDLTPEECEFIAGGLAIAMTTPGEYPQTPPPTITVVHPPAPPSPLPPPTPLPTPTPTPPSPPPSTGGGTGGSGQGGYSTSDASSAANAFANSHMANAGTTADDAKWAQRIHDDLAHLYDYAAAHPNEMMDIGHDQLISMKQVMAYLQKSFVFISDNESFTAPPQGTNRGAATVAGSLPAAEERTSYFIPGNSYSQVYENNYQGNQGIDYDLFHELGHALNFADPTGNGYDEAAANTAGRSIEEAMGLSLMHFHDGTIAPPGGGYD